MRHDKEALLRTICATPEDDLPRLVYADLLEESGDPIRLSRAEFIRIQCALARMKSGHPEHHAMQERERVLLARHRRAWNGPVHRRLIGTPLQGEVCNRRGLVRGWNYRRGFIAELSARAVAVAAHAELLMSLGPIESLHVVGVPGNLRPLLYSPLLPKLKELDLIDHPLQTQDIVALSETTVLTGLRALRVRGFSQNFPGRQSIAAAVRQGRLPTPTF